MTRLRQFVRIAFAIAATAQGLAIASDRKGADPLAGVELPDAWEAKFWDEPGVKAILKLEPKAIAALVPVQAGLRFCRCPGCDSEEAEDTLRWSGEKPDVVSCRLCQAHYPNDKIPAKKDDKYATEDSIEVLPRKYHKYPYHVVEDEKQRYPDERLYLHAKRDYEAREALGKFALYAAVRYREQPPGKKDANLALLSSVLILRFAQVYPSYAVHYDQPGEPKFFQSADLPPPYRRNYKSAKWDWSGCLDVPLNLVMAYAILRDDPAMVEAGKLLDDPNPRRTIERDLFRGSADFVRHQSEECSESSIYAYRGMLAVGRLLGDPELTAEAMSRLEEFSRRGFFHDGFWRRGDLRAHRLILDQFDGWFSKLLPTDPTSAPSLALARSAEVAVLSPPRSPEVIRAAWPPISPRPLPRHPAMLGGAGVARLSIGSGLDAMDLELRGLGDLGGQSHTNRLALRLAIGGRPVLGDLDDQPPTSDGWDLSTASHNLVVVDGLNQRESTEQARVAAPGSDILFFAADPDFQVATMEDRFAYPGSTTRYRETVVACAGRSSRYALSVFEVWGGLQHDQLFQAAAGQSGRWRSSVATEPGPTTLLPAKLTYVPNTSADEGRWFVQSMGAFRKLTQSRIDRPSTASLDAPGGGVRLHLLDTDPMSMILGGSADPAAATADDASDRAALVLRRRSIDGGSLKTTFVTLFEPIGSMAPLKRVGRVTSAAESVVILVETAEGVEHLVLNLTPGIRREAKLIDGRILSTDALVVRETGGGLTMAGGTQAETPGRGVTQSRAAGAIRRSGSGGPPGVRGWFETDAPLTDLPSLAGRALLIRHGDGSTRGWTIDHAEESHEGTTRLFVREEPGFQIDPATKLGHYYQFPTQDVAGPHTFRVAKIAR